MTAHRYRLGDVVIDRVEDDVWIAPLPSGPIMLLQGVSYNVPILTYHLW